VPRFGKLSDCFELGVLSPEIVWAWSEPQTDRSVATLNFLSGWLSEHILDSDRDYAQFLVGRGVR
jgi:hemerythrin